MSQSIEEILDALWLQPASADEKVFMLMEALGIEAQDLKNPSPDIFTEEEIALLNAFYLSYIAYKEKNNESHP